MLWIYEAVGAYLSRALGVEIHTRQSAYDPLEDPAVLEDRLELAFLCGLPLVRRNWVQPSQLVPLVAPVMQAPRYAGQPAYYADLIVHRDNPATVLAELAGQRLCYNDLGSNSGYNLLRYRLLQAAHTQSFFSQVLASGSHQCSIQWIAQGQADCAAIDSTVLEQAGRDAPELVSQLRVLESLGPCPMPPVVAAQHLGAPLLEQIRSALLVANQDLQLQQVLQQGGIQTYVAVQPEDYTPIGLMHQAAIEAGYETIR
ncbi:PhnD/SsuA/transferrin family substrate-binding protein [Leptolyngbya sp. FACHB-261]|nr:PhnD/SsuA/transferrin family substrate-binding protein [Leptolyngbya sp. FACHB-261]